MYFVSARTWEPVSWGCETCQLEKCSSEKQHLHALRVIIVQGGASRTRNATRCALYIGDYVSIDNPIRNMIRTPPNTSTLLPDLGLSIGQGGEESDERSQSSSGLHLFEKPLMGMC